MTRTAFLITLALCWLPAGIIHYGQRRVNDRAEPIINLSSCRFDRADWGGCK